VSDECFDAAAVDWLEKANAIVKAAMEHADAWMAGVSNTAKATTTSAVWKRRSKSATGIICVMG
jgi:hypothetical protein